MFAHTFSTLNKIKSSVPPLFSRSEILTYSTDKAEYFARKFPSNFTLVSSAVSLTGFSLVTNSLMSDMQITPSIASIKYLTVIFLMSFPLLFFALSNLTESYHCRYYHSQSLLDICCRAFLIGEGITKVFKDVHFFHSFYVHEDLGMLVVLLTKTLFFSVEFHTLLLCRILETLQFGVAAAQ